MSENITKKKYTVICFSQDESVEIIPSLWLNSETEARWPPPTCPLSTVKKWILRCEPPHLDWCNLEVRIYSFSNSFKRAQLKVETLRMTSAISSDSSEEETTKRKRKPPTRFLSDESSEEENEDLSLKWNESTRSKMDPKLKKEMSMRKKKRLFNVSEEERDQISSKQYELPKWTNISRNPGISDSKNLNSSQSSQACSNVNNPEGSQPAIYTSPSSRASFNVNSPEGSECAIYSSQSSRACSNVNNPEGSERAIYQRMFKYLENLSSKVGDMSNQIKRLVETSSVCVEGIGRMPIVPPETNLPLSTEEELITFNKKLLDPNYAAKIVQYLHQICHGRTPRNLVDNITRKILTQDLALQYSRFGRKGKQSFQKYPEALRTIIGAAALTFKDESKETLCVTFGKVLACAGEWSGRKPRVQEEVEDSLEKVDETGC